MRVTIEHRGFRLYWKCPCRHLMRALEFVGGFPLDPQVRGCCQRCGRLAGTWTQTSCREVVEVMSGFFSYSERVLSVHEFGTDKAEVPPGTFNERKS